MELSEEKRKILEELNELSDTIDPSYNEVSVILAAGHGKRIKSERSKMLHEIWGKPSVLRVSEAAIKGLSSPNQVIIVGKKALEVARALVEYVADRFNRAPGFFVARSAGPGGRRGGVSRRSRGGG